MNSTGRLVRRSLDGIYTAAGGLAAICLVAILVTIVMQIAARYFGIAFPGSNQYAGYFMAAASFLAFARTLNTGGHIRVNFLSTLLPRYRFWVELWCLVLASAISGYVAYYAVKAVYWSRKLHDISQGQDATPLWIPQTAMAVGAVLVAVAFFDNLVTLAITGHDNVGEETLEQARTE